MPEKYHPQEDLPEEPKKRFMIQVEQAPAPIHETHETPFDEEKYTTLMVNIGNLITTVNNIDSGASSETAEDLPQYIDPVLHDIHLVDQAFARDIMRWSAMTKLKDILKLTQTQEHPQITYCLSALYRSAAKILRRNINKIEEYAREDSPVAIAALRTAIAMRDYGALNSDRREAVRILKENVGRAELFMNSDFPRYSDLLEIVFEYGDDDRIDQWHENVLARLESDITWDQFLARHAIKNLFESRAMSARRYGKEIVGHELWKHGIDAKDALNAWSVSTRRKEVPAKIVENLGAIDELEEKQPMSAMHLYNEFSVKDFARYPFDLLLAQDANSENVDSPYGIVMYCRKDHNGAAYQTLGALQELYRSVSGGYQIRVMEYDGKPDFARKLLELRKRYGGKHNISFAVILEHGNQNTIGSLLAAKDVGKQRVMRAKEFFEEDPTIILVSCSTGAPRGIGQKLSEATGARVIAPDVETNIRSLSAGIKDGKLVFEVGYSHAQAQVYEKGHNQSERADDQRS